MIPIASAAGATLSFSPDGGTYAVGKSFTVFVVVDSGGGVGVNAADGTVNFDKDLLSVTGVSRDGSIFSLWTTEPTYSNAQGTVIFGGGSPTAYTKNSGTILGITFKTKKLGSAAVSISGASVLAADGKGTNVFSSAQNALYVITEGEEKKPPPQKSSAGPVPKAPEIISSTHPNEDTWYSENAPEFSWKLPKGVTGVSVMLTNEPESNPGPLSDGLLESKVYEDVEDGEWYFHIKFRNANGWSKITHRKVLIDTVSPKEFTVDVAQKDRYDAAPVLTFITTDEHSGMAYYEISIDGGEAIRIDEKATTTYSLLPQSAGTHTITVRAYDAAGNVREAFAEIDVEELVSKVVTEEGKQIPAFWWWIIIAIVAVLIITNGVVFMLYIRLRKHTESERKQILEAVEQLRIKIQKIFTALRAEVEDDVPLADRKEKVSAAEKQVMEKLEDALSMSEELIETDIEYLEKTSKKNTK